MVAAAGRFAGLKPGTPGHWIWAALSRDGFESVPSDFVSGVTNMSCPIRDIRGHALASLTVPYLHWQGDKAVATLDDTLAQLLLAAEQISDRVLAG